MGKNSITDWYADMQDFHKIVMGDNFLDYPHIPDKKYLELRKALIKEEVKETLDAMDREDMVEIADGIVDSIVVLLGTAVTYGIDLRKIWNIIHETNMAKKDGPVREDGKKLKPEGWKPPDIKSELLRQGWLDN
jgi:predicted HAD superfamily Cof-like phosphohydrolase